MVIYGIAFNWIDFAFLALITICFLFGVGTGLIMQVASLFSVVAGMASGFLAGPYVAGLLSPWIENHIFANALGYFICFFLTASLIRLFAYFLKGILEKYKLKRFDRLAGGFIGAIKGALLCTILILIAGYAGSEPLRQPVDVSFAGRHIMSAANQTLEQPMVASIIDKLKGIFSNSPETSAQEE